MFLDLSVSSDTTTEDTEVQQWSRSCRLNAKDTQFQKVTVIVMMRTTFPPRSSFCTLVSESKLKWKISFIVPGCPPTRAVRSPQWSDGHDVLGFNQDLILVCWFGVLYQWQTAELFLTELRMCRVRKDRLGLVVLHLSYLWGATGEARSRGQRACTRSAAAPGALHHPGVSVSSPVSWIPTRLCCIELTVQPAEGCSLHFTS